MIARQPAQRMIHLASLHLIFFLLASCSDGIAVPTTTLPITATMQSSCDNSAFINDTSVPDGMVMAAGADFVKTWKVKNTGTCAWTTGYNIVFSYGEKMSGAATALTAEVSPNSDAEISINLKAPLKSGTYSGYWRLSNNNGYAFGEIFTVVITVP